MSRQRSWNLCLAGAAALVVLAAIIGCWTVPAILHRPLPVGALLIFSTWGGLLTAYGWWEIRR